MILAYMFSRKWLLTTLLVLLGTALCIRLGFWQLDRLAQRQAANAHYLEMTGLPPVVLPGDDTTGLAGMEFRTVTAAGEFDFDHQVALRNQYFRGQLGYHLLTPLVLADGTAIMVDRGWVPAAENAAPDDWRQYDQPGPVQVSGILRPGRQEPDMGGVPDPTLAPGQTRLDFWFLPNLVRLQGQVPYPLAPAYIQPDLDPEDSTPPVPYQPVVEITEGSHQSYALQWFTFAALLFLGYPFYLRDRLKKEDGK